MRRFASRPPDSSVDLVVRGPPERVVAVGRAHVHDARLGCCKKLCLEKVREESGGDGVDLNCPHHTVCCHVDQALCSGCWCCWSCGGVFR
jgi:hypothetical protein